LQEKLFVWLEENNTVIEKAPEINKAKSAKKTTTKINKEKKSSKTPKS